MQEKETQEKEIMQEKETQEKEICKKEKEKIIK